MTPVLLPGNMCDARLWRGGNSLIPEALLDAGLSMPVDADLTRDDSIAAMAERTLAKSQGPIVPIGFSMGAIVAVEMWVLAPHRIAGLVLIGYNATADLPERAVHRPVQQAAVRRGGLETILTEELKPNYLAAANRGDQALLSLLRDMGLALGPDVFLRQSEALRGRGDRVAALPAIKVPVFVGGGAEDLLCPPAWHDRWAAALPDATQINVPGAGHMLPLEAPAVLAEQLHIWINRKGLSS